MKSRKIQSLGDISATGHSSKSKSSSDRPRQWITRAVDAELRARERRTGQHTFCDRIPGVAWKNSEAWYKKVISRVDR